MVTVHVSLLLLTTLSQTALDPTVDGAASSPAAERPVDAVRVETSPAAGTAATTTADSPAPATPDSALLAELLRLFATQGADERQAAVGAAAHLGDARLADALTYLAEHDNSADVAGSAVKALGQMPSHGGLGALDWLARHGSRMQVRDAAVAALGASGDPAAGPILYALASDRELSSGVRREAVDALRAHFPELLAERGAPEVAGAIWLPMLAGGAFGGYTLYTVGRFAKSSVGPAIGAVGGILIGGASGLMLSQRLTTERSFFHTSAMGWGLWAGINAALAAQRDQKTDTTLAIGMLGELAGLAFSCSMADSMDFRAGDVWVTHLGGFAGLGLAAGALQFARPRDDRRPAFGVMLGAGLAGLGASAAVAKALEFDAGDRLLVVLGGVEGAWFGGFAPSLFHNDHSDGGLMIGASLGVLGTAAASQWVTLTPATVGKMFVFASYAKALGAGTSMMAKASTRGVIGTQLALGAVGLAAGALVGPDARYDGGDLTLIPIATLIGLWHGIGIGSYLNEKNEITDKQTGGMVLTGAAAFGLGALAISQATKISAMEVGVGSTGAFWGGWFLAWTAVRQDWKTRDRVLGALIGSDVGLLATAILVSPLLDTDPWIVAGASMGGVASTVLATMGAAFATKSRDAIVTTMLVSGAVGLGAGAVVTALVLDDGSKGRGSSAAGRDATGLALGDWPVRLVGIGPQPHLDAVGRLDGAVMSAVFSTH